MDHQNSQEESPHSLDQHLVNIKDYSQHQHSEAEEDSPFDELEHILDQDDNRDSRNEVFNERIRSLEEKCATLRSRNQVQERRNAELQTDLNEYEQLAQDDTLPNDLLETVEKQLAEFKNAFQEYRSKAVKAAQEKEGQIQKLRAELEKANQERQLLEEEKQGLQDNNDDLSKNNENLILEIEKLENELADSRSEINSSRSYRFGSRRDHGFESEVQAELEILIEKLMSELQLERNHKRRLNEEIKRMQKETLILEKEITSKNNKIYELEMNSLKQNRTKNSQVSSKPYEKYPRPSRESLNRSDRSLASLKTINLMQLLNNNDLTEKERLLISSKLIDFYSRKINSKDYASYDLESLLICNYNKPNPIISVSRDCPAPAADASQEKMLYNLGEILDILLGEFLSEVKEQDSGEQYLLNLIGQILSDKSVNINDIYVIKQLIEDCLRSRK